MAITYDFGNKFEQSASYSSGNRATATQHRQPFNCIVTDPADGNFDPKTITPEMVLEQGHTQGDIPVPGLSVWTDGTDVDIFSICNGQRVSRHATNPGIFEGESTYQSQPFLGVSAISLVPKSIQAAVANYYAIWELSYREAREVMYEDLTTPTPQVCRLPTGSYFTQPFYDRNAAQSYLITQLEDGIGTTDLEDRAWSVNSATYQGAAPGWWMVEGIAAQRVRVPITGNAVHESFLVQYQIKKHHKRTWWDERALFDYYHLAQAGDSPADKVGNYDKNSLSMIELMLETNGTLRDPVANPTPAYTTFKDLKEVDFNTFIRPNTNPLP
jgi:hypothetical protein